MKTIIKLPLSKRWNIGLWIAAMIVVLDAARANLFTIKDDFDVTYNAAHALLIGGDPYLVNGYSYIYPPFFAFLMMPLTLLPERAAHTLLIFINIILIGLNLWLALKVLASAFKLKLNRWQAIGVCSLAVLLTQDNIFQEFNYCQNDLMVLFGMTLALYWLQRYPEIAGVILGLVANIKYQTLVFFPLLIFRARWRVLAGLAAGLTVAGLLPAVLIGWGRNLQELKFALQGVMNVVGVAAVSRTDVARVPSILWKGNVSITSGLGRIFNHFGLTISDTLFVIAMLMGLVFIVLWKIFRRHHIPFLWRTPQRLGNDHQENAIISLEWWVAVLVMIVFSPECTRRHLVLALCFNLLPAIMLLFPQPGLKRWPIVLAIISAQIGQLRFGLWGVPTGDIIGLPGWGYLFSLLLVAYSTMDYYLTIYNHKPSLTQYPHRFVATKAAAMFD